MERPRRTGVLSPHAVHTNAACFGEGRRGSLGSSHIPPPVNFTRERMRRVINAPSSPASSPAPTGPAASNSSVFRMLKCCLKSSCARGDGVVIEGMVLRAPGLLHSVVPYLWSRGILT